MNYIEHIKLFLLLFLIRDNWALQEEPDCYGGDWFGDVTCKNANLEYISKYVEDKQNIYGLTCNYCEIPTLTKEFLQNQNLKNLEQIELTNCGLKKIEANIFEGLPKLIKIDLSRNKIESIDNDVLTSTSVKTIDISSNNIKKIDHTIFDKLPQLKELNLNSNNLTSIDRETFPAHLNELHLMYNQITTIKSYAFCKQSEKSNLTQLSLKYNPIKIIRGKVFENLEKLKQLDLSEMGIEMLDHNAFHGLNSLEKLDLSKNNLTYISEYAFPLKQLKELNLNENENLHLPVNVFFDLNLVTELVLPKHCYHELQPGLFNGLKSLSILDLNHLGIKDLQPEVFKGLPGLKQLGLRNNSLTHIKKNTFLGLKQLTTLNLMDNPIQTIDAFAFSELYKVIDFYLPENLIIPKICSHQFFGLRSVKYLNLRNYSIEKIESGAFLGMNSLIKLDLSDNRIHAIYPHAFVITLKELYLQNNFIKQFEYANVFDDLKFLQKLNISSNYLIDFNDKVFMPLKYITQLDISNNSLTNFYVEELTCLYTTYLNQLYLHDNQWNCTRLESILTHLNKLRVKFYPEYPQVHVTNIAGIQCDSKNNTTSHVLAAFSAEENEDRYMVCKEYFEKTTTEIIITTSFQSDITVTPIQDEEDEDGWVIYYYVDEMSFVSFLIIIVIGVIIGCMASSIFSQSSEGTVYPAVTSVSSTVATIDNTLPTYEQCSHNK